MIGRILLILLLALSAFGCSGDRSTGNTDHSTVPTAHFSDQLILKVSDSISVENTGFDTSAVTLHFSDSLLGEFGANPEIYLTHVHRNDSPLKFEVFSPSTSNWIRLDGPSAYTDIPPNIPEYFRLLSGWAAHPLSFLDSTDGLRVRGTFHHVDVRLAELDPEYASRILNEKAWFVDIVWSDGMLVLNLVVTDSSRGQVGRIEWRDSEGSIIRSASLALPGAYMHQLVASGSTLWTVSHYDGVVRLSTDGAILNRIQLRLPEGAFAYWQGTVWANEQIRVPVRFGMGFIPDSTKLLGIDPWKSVDSGYTVLNSLCPWPLRLLKTDDIEWDGATFRVLEGNVGYWGPQAFGITNGHIFRVSIDGQILDSIACPVNACDMAWDGEAYWIVHHGTPELPSTDLLLSRFYPR